MSHQCSATTARQPPTLTILSNMYCTGGTECLSCTPGNHSTCALRTPLGVDWKILSIRTEIYCNQNALFKSDISSCSIFYLRTSEKETVPTIYIIANYSAAKSLSSKMFLALQYLKVSTEEMVTPMLRQSVLLCLSLFSL